MTVATEEMSGKFDTSTCDEEPIQQPGMIQSQGFLFAIDPTTLQIVQVSENVKTYLGLSAQELLQLNFKDFLTQDSFKSLGDIKQLSNPQREPVRVHDIEFQNPKNALFQGSIHFNGTALVLELEPFRNAATTLFDLLQTYNDFLTNLKDTHTVLELCQKTADAVQYVSGFERIMIYRFDEHWRGEVVAECKVPNVDSFLGLRYPASDIPKNARALYHLNSFRLIHNVDDIPSKLFPEINPMNQQPLDMSRGFLRGVSPLHIEYLKNMRVTASLSMPIIRDNALWGVIACQHHQGALPIPIETRAACSTLAQLMSIQLAAKEDAENYQYRVHLQSLQPRFVEQMAINRDFIDAKAPLEKDILDLVNATGAALFMNGNLQLIGETLSEADTLELLSWLENQIKDNVFSTNSFKDSGFEIQEASPVCGVLAVTLSNDKKNFLLWFRSEVVHSVQWAGNPTKSVEYDESGKSSLHPRKSFEVWKETVYGHSDPWLSPEIQAALDIRASIIGIILKKADELAILNAELESRNNDLDSFAYIASHDLKEPLRGIHNYSQILLVETEGNLDERSTSMLQTLTTLSQRMENIINSLLNYSQQDRTEAQRLRVNINHVIDNALERLQITLDQQEIVIKRGENLPDALCDESGLAEVLSNLIVNGIKYNESHPKVIEIGHCPSGKEGFNRYFVKDNGIGIDYADQQSIFRMFKRLHPRDEFGGGTGAGLAIAKKIIERNGGELWVESIIGEGASFFFTLKSVRENECIGNLHQF